MNLSQIAAVLKGAFNFASFATNADNTLSLQGPNGVIAPNSATLVAATTTATTIASAASGALATYQKITLDTKGLGNSFPDNSNVADIANSRIIAPSWAKFIKVTGHLSFPDQNVGSGHASLHLWRNVGATPQYTAAGLAVIAAGGLFQPNGICNDAPTPEGHYHNRIYYPQLATTYYISVLAMTGWIPIMALNESWTLYAWQNSGGSVNTTTGVDAWLTAEFM